MNINEKAIQEIQQLTGAQLTLGSHVASIRQGEGWNQSQLADLLGVSRQFICDLEHGRRNLSPKMAEEFAIKLGYSPRQFVKLCVQQMFEKQGLHYQIDLKVA
jgi:transcriptional regulator with XRE-family HTH domain